MSTTLVMSDVLDQLRAAPRTWNRYDIGTGVAGGAIRFESGGTLVAPLDAIGATDRVSDDDRALIMNAAEDRLTSRTVVGQMRASLLVAVGLR